MYVIRSTFYSSVDDEDDDEDEDEMRVNGQ